MKKAGFSFIELVFSIVIIGLVILSIPLIVRQSNANIMESQNVLGYYNALTLMETIKNKPWDTNNVSDFEKSGEYYILNTDTTKFNCEKVKDTNIFSKPGLGNADRRRMCDPNQTKASIIRSNSALNSINSFHGYSKKIQGGGNDYFEITATIRYADINFGSGTTQGFINPITTNATSDVKQITIQLFRINPNTSTNELTATFNYYAANIGTDIPFSKDN